MDFDELKNKSKEDLTLLLAAKREAGRSLKFKLASGQLKKSQELGANKKTIARILTVLKNK